MHQYWVKERPCEGRIVITSVQEVALVCHVIVFHDVLIYELDQINQIQI